MKVKRKGALAALLAAVVAVAVCRERRRPPQASRS